MTQVEGTQLEGPLLIIGAGGQGKVVADAAAACGERDIRFADAQWPNVQWCSVWPIVCGTDPAALRAIGQRVHIAIGAGALREQLAGNLRAAGFELVTITHPRAVVSRYARIGAGCYLGPLACVNIDTELGDCVIVNTSASVDHDCRIGAFSHIAPGAHLAGNVIVGTRSWVGLGAAVRGGARIGDDVTVGAGAVVVKDVSSGLTVAGVPAVPLHKGSPIRP